MDGFHLDGEVLVALGRRERKGAPDTFDVGGYVSMLRRLRSNDEEVVYAPVFDRAREISIAGALPIARGIPLVITEGNYLLHDDECWSAVRTILDEVWYLDVDAEQRVSRLISRRTSYGESTHQARSWVERVDEKNAEVVAVSRVTADLVVQLREEVPLG